MSPSMSPTRAPACRSATARLLATVDFPTPPLPLEMAMTCPSSGYATGCCGGGTCRAGRLSMTGSARPPPPAPLGPFSVIPRNLQDLARCSEDAFPHVIERAGDQRTGRARMTAAAEGAREGIDVHATRTAERCLDLPVAQVTEEHRHPCARDGTRVLDDSVEVFLAYVKLFHRRRRHGQPRQAYFLVHAEGLKDFRK